MRHRTRIETLAAKFKPAYDMPIVIGFSPENYEGQFSYKRVLYPLEQLEEVAASLNIMPGLPRVVGFVPVDMEVMTEYWKWLGIEEGGPEWNELLEKYSDEVPEYIKYIPEG